MSSTKTRRQQGGNWIPIASPKERQNIGIHRVSPIESKLKLSDNTTVLYIDDGKRCGSYGCVHEITTYYVDDRTPVHVYGMMVKIYTANDNTTTREGHNYLKQQLLSSLMQNNLFNGTSFAPLIVEYYPYFVHDSGYFLKRCDGTLYDYEKNRNGTGPSLLKLVIDVEKYIRKCIECGIVHGDIKFDNLLYQQSDENVSVLVHDWDGSRIYKENEPIPFVTPSLPFASPIVFYMNNFSGSRLEDVPDDPLDLLKASFGLVESSSLYKKMIATNTYIGALTLSDFTTRWSKQNLVYWYTHSDLYALGVSCIIYSKIHTKSSFKNAEMTSLEQYGTALIAEYKSIEYHHLGGRNLKLRK